MKNTAASITKSIKALLLSVSLFGVASCSKTEVDLEDITGVWRGDSDGSMIEFNIAGSNPKIKIGDKVFNVKIKEVDNDNQIVSVIVNGEPNMVWSIRKVWDDDKKKEFTLDMTLQDGTNDSLSFVRNL
jgi:hypothetical protein